MCFQYLRILEALLLGSALSSVIASSTSNCKHNLDVVAVLDGSGSIESSDFAKLKTATIQLARDLNLRPNSQRFGVVVFSNTVTNTIPLSSSFTNLRRRISRIRQPGQGTNTHLGIQSMTRILRTGRTSKKVGIVITDGRSGSEQATKQAAKIAKQAGIKMFSVGVGTNINMAELRSIASSFSNVLLLKNFDALKDRFKSLVRKICIVNGGWSSWSAPSYGSCSKSCGRGTRTVTRRRTCTNPRPSGGGKKCYGSTTHISYQACIAQQCPLDGGWSAWSRPVFGSCTKSCGGGTQSVTKKRTCTKPSPKWGGKNCSGASTNISSQTCNTRHCPVEGGWSSWSRPALGSCSKSCGGGTQSVTKKRTCTKPSPKWGGKNCSGASTNISSQTCNTQHCPVHGGWSSWTTMSRSSCSATCGGGAITVRQNRTCTKPTPQYGGKRCSGSDTNVYTVACNTFKCVSANGFAVCDSCHYENGVGYVPHPTDCRFYIQCISWGAAYHIRPCAPGLYWKQDTLSCVRPSDVNCTTTATAAPPLQQDTTPAPSTPVPGSTPTCQMKAVPGKASMYSVYVVGHGPMERPCSPGTVFSTALCRCISGGRQTSPSGKRCQDEVYLPLTADVKDHSKHKLYIKNKGVKVNKKGQAVFAHNAVIHIPRFSNMDFGKTLHISFMLYKVNNTAKDQAIVSNANCNRTGSIYIIRKPSAVEFRVRNRNGVFANVIIPQTKATSRVTLTVHKGAMMGSVNGVYKKTAFKGRIATVHCGLLLGRGTGYDSFTGFLKKFKLSLCKP